MSGYCSCACFECFEIAIGKRGEALCWECKEAGCEPTVPSEGGDTSAMHCQVDGSKYLEEE